MRLDTTNLQANDDEYQNALLGDVGLATRTNPNIPIKSLFPHLDVKDDGCQDDGDTLTPVSCRQNPLDFLIKLFRKY